MITQYVFMTEEASMEEFLKVYMKRSYREEISYIIISHEGKQDLEKSIPRKLKA